MPSPYKALNDASHLAHAQLTGASPNPEAWKPVTRNDLIGDILQRWLGDTLSRLRIPQRKELDGLLLDQLKIVSKLDPDEPKVVSEAATQDLNPFLVARLLRRRKLARELAEAEARNPDLYDMVEHCMSEAELF